MTVWFAAHSQCRHALFIPFTSQLQLSSCTVPSVAWTLCCIHNCILHIRDQSCCVKQSAALKDEQSNNNCYNFYLMTTGTSLSAQNWRPLDATPGSLSLCLIGVFPERSEVGAHGWKYGVFHPTQLPFHTVTKEWQWWNVLRKSEIVPLCAFQIDLGVTMLHHV